MKATLVATIEDLKAAGPGAILPARNSSGTITALLHRCPGCGEVGAIPVARPLGGDPSWRLSGPIAAPTLSPSVVHGVTEFGGCRWYGRLVDGEWKLAAEL